MFCDILTIAAIFVLRAVTGVVVIGAVVSIWFLAEGVGCLALLLALGKRLSEVRLLSETQRVHRITLRAYQQPRIGVMACGRWRSLPLPAMPWPHHCLLLPALHPLVMLTTIPVFAGTVWRYTRLRCRRWGRRTRAHAHSRSQHDVLRSELGCTASHRGDALSSTRALPVRVPRVEEVLVHAITPTP